MNTIKKAISHFTWKFKNVWKPTKEDVEAYNTIVDFVEKKHKEQFNDYQLFAKLYVTFYGELLKFYNCSVFDNQPEKVINKILDTPIETLIEKFVEKANTQETSLAIEKAGIEIKDIRLKSVEQIEQEGKKFNFEMLDPIMTYEEAVTNLTNQINLSINKFK